MTTELNDLPTTWVNTESTTTIISMMNGMSQSSEIPNTQDFPATSTTNNTETKFVCQGGFDPAPSEINYGTRIFLGTLLVLIDIVVIIGNILVIVAICKFDSLRQKMTNYFIISLSVADLMVGVCVLPFAAIQDIVGKWLFREYCLSWVSFDVMMSTASILSLMMISIERYIAITRPFHYHEIITVKTTVIMLSVVWTLSTLISFLPIHLEMYKVAGDKNALEYALDPVFPLCKLTFAPVYAIISSCISFYIPLAIMIGVYSRVFAIARQQAKRIATTVTADANGTHRSKKESKASKTLALVMGVFTACWLPFFVINCTYGWDPEIMLCRPYFLDIFSFFVWLGWLNSVFNPFIYALNPQFRRAYTKLLCRWSTSTYITSGISVTQLPTESR